MEKHFVKFIPNAGLGNQLYFFTYCNYLKEVLGKDASLLVFESHSNDNGDSFNKEVRNPVLDIADSLGIKIYKINSNWEFYQLRWNKLPFYKSVFSKILYVCEEDEWAVFNDLSKQKKYQINLHTGYYQAYQYLTENFRQTLKTEINELDTLSKYEISETDVAVHIRRGDFNKFPEIFNLFGISYYKKALRVIENKISIGNVYIFSDSFIDIQEEIDFISQNYNVILVENQSVLQDFRLLMKFCNYAIGNSTFSWWAARLSDCSNPLVVVPKDPIKIIKQNSEPYPKDWIIIEKLKDV